MSELMNTKNSERGFRRQLLTTVSALALLASVTTHDAKAADDDTSRPTVWIELGGLLEHVEGQGEPFTPAFVAANPNSPVLHPVSPIQAQNPVPFSFGEEGSISFQPDNSDWVFSAAIRYGRSGSVNKLLHQTDGTFHLSYKYGAPGQPTQIFAIENFAETQARRSESHAVIDFRAGKDVGLGIFSKDASSILSLGVRFAQFSSNATFDVRARPDLQFEYLTFGPEQLKLPYFHTYHATGQASRSFRGVGPSLSWTGSAPVMGNPQDGEMMFDWGVNAAVLFGRQRERAQHQESAHYESPLCQAGITSCTYDTPSYQHPVRGHNDVRSVIVPNAGGMAGASLRIQNVKVSVGYRADFFFHAMDVGIDTRKSETLGFYGPFASVSIGLGG